jgi:tRNA-splicing ligase RtcB
VKPPAPIRLERIDECRVRIPRTGAMNGEGLIFADHKTLEHLRNDQSPQQVANVACLPGLVGLSMAMPDIHWGYGFPIGGVAAFAEEDGVVSPGGVGYDINCGVRLLRSRLREEDVRPRIRKLVDALYETIPTGVGARRDRFKLSKGQLKALMERGAEWVVEQEMGTASDLDHLESGGRIPEAGPDAVSERAIERGLDQVGTLGSGNHFGEVGVVDQVFDEKVAAAFGLQEGMITFMIHCGSRGLGHQVAEDYMRSMEGALPRHGIDLPDRQLVCAPIKSSDGQRYLAAMRAAANFAFANRQMITHLARGAFRKVLGRSDHDLGLSVVYDVCHNIAKIEEHEWEGKTRRVCVHRKGATRAFPAGHAEISDAYRGVGHPVLIPGDMGRYSFVLVGTDQAMHESWGSSCHGAGRLKSRSRIRKEMQGRQIDRELAERGIYVRAHSRRVLAEEVSEAYKDVADVVEVVEKAGIASKVARLRPIGNIKG